MSELSPKPQGVLFIALRHAEPVSRTSMIDDPGLSHGADEAIKQKIEESIKPKVLGRYVVITCSSGANRTLQTAEKMKSSLADASDFIVVHNQIIVEPCFNEDATIDHWNMVYISTINRLSKLALEGAMANAKHAPEGGAVIVVSHSPTLAIIKSRELPEEPKFGNGAYLEDFSFVYTLKH